jgi:hypothetical protein
MNVTINNPITSYQAINTDNDARFEATTSPLIASDTGWVKFEIIHVATSKVLWSQVDFGSVYCAFSHNSSPCNGPESQNYALVFPSPYTQYSWNLLTNGLYELVVTAQDSAGNVGQARRYFIVDGH